MSAVLFDEEKHCGNPNRISAHLRLQEKIAKNHRTWEKSKPGSKNREIIATTLRLLRERDSNYERDVKPCLREKGYKTGHPGVGLCKWHCECHGEPNAHGMALNLGMYAARRNEGALAEIGRLLVSEGDPGDLEGELTIVRGILAAWLKSRGSLNLSSADIRDATKLVEVIGETVERINTLKLKTAVSRDAVQILQERMASVLKAVVTDQDMLEKVLVGWGQIAVSPDAKMMLVE